MADTVMKKTYSSDDAEEKEKQGQKQGKEAAHECKCKPMGMIDTGIYHNLCISVSVEFLAREPRLLHFAVPFAEVMTALSSYDNCIWQFIS